MTDVGLSVLSYVKNRVFATLSLDFPRVFDFRAFEKRGI